MSMVILCMISQIMKHLLIKFRKHSYDAALAITGAITGTSRGKLYGELDLESLKFRRCLGNWLVFIKFSL